MTKNSHLILLILFFSFSNISSKDLKSSEINTIEKNFSNGLITYNYTIKESEDAYFSFNISDFQVIRMVFTIHNSVNQKINIQCIQSKSTKLEDLKREFKSWNNNCSTLVTSTHEIINVIANIYENKENPNLYLHIKNQYGNLQSNLTFFIRENLSFKRELKTEEISNPAAYIVYEIDPLEYYNKTRETDLLLTTTKEELLIYRNFSKDDFYSIESDIYLKTYFLPLSQQSIAAQFNEYSYNMKLLIFVGVKEYLENDTIILYFSQMDKNTKLYYYIFKEYKQVINFYYNCNDDITKHYLFVDYDELKSEEKYYFRFHDLIGSEARIAQIQLGENDFKNFKYSDSLKFNYFSQEISHMHIIELKCPGDKNKILANIKYSRKENERDLVSFSYFDDIRDYPFTFGEKNLTVDYNEIPTNELAVEIFIPNKESNKTLKIYFENEVYEVLTDKTYFFEIIDTQNFTNFTLASKEVLQAFVTVSGQVRKKKIIVDRNKYIAAFYGNSRSSETYYIYEIEHEFNTNYYIDFEMINYDSRKKFCYQVSNIGIPTIYSQNCFLLDYKESKNISLHIIFKYTENDDYNTTESKYILVVYHERRIVAFKDVYFKTDLPYSKDINYFKVGHNYQYLNASLERGKASYFNVALNNKTTENNINLYILSESTMDNNELLFDLKCIKAYEPYLDYITHNFIEQKENECHIVNNKDFNSNVYHIIYNDIKIESHEKLIIQIIPKTDLNIILMTDYSKIILTKFNFRQNRIINDSLVHQIYELNKEDILSLSEKLIYNKHYNGLKLYARNKYDFEEINKGSLIEFNKEEINAKYKNYDKFLLIIGQNDCINYKESNSIFEVIWNDDVFYYSLTQTNSYNRILIQNKDYNKMYQYIIIDYDKQYLKGDIHFTYYTLLGQSFEISFQSELKNSIFDEPDVQLKKYKIIKNNNQHLIIVRSYSAVNFEGYLDFFSEIDYSSQIIKLNKSSIKTYIIPKGKNYTFNYEEIDSIKMELLNDNEDPIIYFEDKKYNLNKDKTITFNKTNNNSELLYIEAPISSNVVIRIICFIDIKNIPKTDLANLYKIESKYIYDFNPKNIYQATFHIKRKYSIYNRLKEENLDYSEINICYNVANMIVLEENGKNCFILKDDYALNYSSYFYYETYLTFYSEAGGDSFFIEKIDELKNVVPTEYPYDDGDGDGNGSKTWIIILSVFLGVLIIALIIIIFIRIKYKAIRSDNIENLNPILK